MPTNRIKEAADLLGISDDTLRRWAEAGYLAFGCPLGECQVKRR